MSSDYQPGVHAEGALHEATQDACAFAAALAASAQKVTVPAEVPSTDVSASFCNVSGVLAHLKMTDPQHAHEMSSAAVCSGHAKAWHAE